MTAWYGPLRRAQQALPTLAGALQAFEDDVLDRLFALNESCAQKEAALGRRAKKAGARKSPAKAGGANKQDEPGTRAKRDAKSSKKGEPGGDSG